MGVTVVSNKATVVAAVAAMTAMLTLLPYASSIQCYQCNSKRDAHCEDLTQNVSTSKTYLHECQDPGMPPNAVPFCRKIVQTILAVGERRVIRKCGFEKSTKPCYHYDNDVHAEVVCQCFEEACNAVPRTSPSAALSALTAVSVVLMLVLTR